MFEPDIIKFERLLDEAILNLPEDIDLCAFNVAIPGKGCCPLGALLISLEGQHIYYPSSQMAYSVTLKHAPYIRLRRFDLSVFLNGFDGKEMPYYSYKSYDLLARDESFYELGKTYRENIY